MVGPGDEHDDDPVRRAAQYRVDREIEREREEAAADGGPGRGEGAGPGHEPGEGAEGAPGGPRRIRMDDRSRFVDTVIDQAIRRGEFDDLPLHGKPIPSLRSGADDPDWWLKNLVEREQITGVLPSAQLRKDAAELDETLDREFQEERVREIVREFNARVVDARRQLTGGPPVVTPTRDVEQEVVRWRQRRADRAAASRPPAAGSAERSERAERARADRPAAKAPGRKPWWRRRR